MDRRQFIAAAIAAGGVVALPESQATSLPVAETNIPALADYDGQVVRFTFNGTAWECVIKYTGMRTVEVNFLNDQEAAKEGWSFVPFRSSLRSPPRG